MLWGRFHVGGFLDILSAIKREERKLEKQLTSIQHKLKGIQAAAEAMGRSADKKVKKGTKRVLSADARAKIGKAPCKRNRQLQQKHTMCELMVKHRTVLLAALILAVCATSTRANQAQGQDQLPANYVPSGGQIYKQYCAACHGPNAKGNGPVKRALRIPAPDLTTLAKRHGGKFPYEYVTGLLRFAPGVPSHGSGEMPTWGALFEYYYNKSSAQQRIQNLSDYLASLQEK